MNISSLENEKNSLNINDRRLIDGPQSKLMCVSPIKHTWADDVWKVMCANSWFPAEVDMSRDIKQYRSGIMTDAQKGMFDKALAFLSNLDGIQFNNLTFNIGRYITSPEVSMCISRQSFEEANHVRAYATMIEAIAADPHYIYGMFATDGVLAKKNDYIMRQSEILGEDYSPRNFALAVVANIILEGIYFYSGFLAFYTLARSGMMLGSADQIRFIQRDELVHLSLFVKMFETLKVENPDIFDENFNNDVYKLFNEAVELETTWGKYLIKGGVLGLTDDIIDDYIRHLADDRLALIGLAPMYNVQNPVSWVEGFSSINGEEANFFESKVKSYSVGGSLEW